MSNIEMMTELDLGKAFCMTLLFIFTTRLFLLSAMEFILTSQFLTLHHADLNLAKDFILKSNFILYFSMGTLCWVLWAGRRTVTADKNSWKISFMFATAGWVVLFVLFFVFKGLVKNSLKESLVDLNMGLQPILTMIQNGVSFSNDGLAHNNVKIFFLY
jgi:hypothetical protein